MLPDLQPNRLAYPVGLFWPKPGNPTAYLTFTTLDQWRQSGRESRRHRRNGDVCSFERPNGRFYEGVINANGAYGEMEVLYSERRDQIGL